MTAMTQEERAQEFRRVLDKIPAERSIERIRKVAGILHCELNTVRIWKLANNSRPIPEAKLKILKDALEKEGLEL